MQSRIPIAISAALILSGFTLAAPAQAVTPTGSTDPVATPSKFTSVTATSGPGAGEITVSWKQDGRDTTGYELETALSSFSKTSSTLPATGRNDRVFAVGKGRQSLTLSASDLTTAGAPLGSGNHLYYRLTAVDTVGKQQAVRAWPKLQAIQPEYSSAVAASGKGTTPLRIASFNVRTAKANDDARPWLDRRADVAQAIVANTPAVVTMQELGPGRADGQPGIIDGAMRQTTSLLDSLSSIGASNYKLVRTTAYVAPGTEHGSQGARILYNADKVDLISNCSETTGSKNYSSSCSVEMPLLDGDKESNRRTAAYAMFADRTTGARFYVVSVHLDPRHSTDQTEEATYDGLRGKQMSTVLSAVAKVNTGGLPVVLGGDLNSWQTITVGNAPHDALIKNSFIDTASAPTRTNFAYDTFNGFAKTQTPDTLGFGTRLDGIYVQGGTAQSFEIVTKPEDSARPSDHNMVLATLTLKK